MSAGRFAVLGYLLAFLVIPMIGLPLLGRPDYSSYHYSGNTWASVLVVLGFCALCLTPLFGWRSLVPSNLALADFARLIYAALQKFVLPLALLLLGAMILLFPPDLANYRYLKSGISDQGAAFFLAIALKSVNTALLVWLLAEFVREPDRRKGEFRIAALTLVAAQIYSASGTGDLFATSFFLLLVLSPKWFIRLATIDRGTSLISRRNLYKFLAVGVVAVQAAVSINIGENIKDGVGTVGESIASSVGAAVGAVEGIAGGSFGSETGPTGESPKPPVVEAVVSTGNWFVIRMLEGIASHYYSTLQFFDGFAQERLESFAAPISYPLAAVRYRLHVLLGKADVERPEIQSISRLNFVVLSPTRQNATEGTSPGAVASFAYLLPLPLAIAAALVYLVLVSVLLNQLFHSDKRQMSLFGGLTVMIQVQVLFQSPLDFLLIVDNGTVFLVAFVFLSLVTGAALNDPAKREN